MAVRRRFWIYLEEAVVRGPLQGTNLTSGVDEYFRGFWRIPGLRFDQASG